MCQNDMVGQVRVSVSGRSEIKMHYSNLSPNNWDLLIIFFFAYFSHISVNNKLCSPLFHMTFHIFFSPYKILSLSLFCFLSRKKHESCLVLVVVPRATRLATLPSEQGAVLAPSGARVAILARHRDPLLLVAAHLPQACENREKYLQNCAYWYIQGKTSFCFRK